MMRLVWRTIKDCDLFDSKARIVAGVSGGADSVAMLYALFFLQRRMGFQLSVAHLNHKIRPEAAAEAVFVRDLAWRLGLPVLVAERDVPRLAKEMKISLEMAARRARLDLWREAIEAKLADRVALAHTLDDHVETFLLRLGRGAGPAGLGGILHKNRISGIPIVRPMREVTHQQTIDFLQRHNLKWCEDASNRDLRFLRNRVRHAVIPLLEKELNPQVRLAIARAADLIGDDNEALEGIARGCFRRCWRAERPLEMEVEELGQCHRAVQGRVFILWLIANGITDVDAQLIEKLRLLVKDRRGSKAIPLSGGRVIERRYGRLHILALDDFASVPIERTLLKVPGQTVIESLSLSITAEWQQGINKAAAGRAGTFPACVSIAAMAVKDQDLFVRGWRPGDFIRPVGLRGRRKVQDVFVDAKIPRDLRALMPVIECKGEIIWAPGARIAEGWEVPSASTAALWIVIDNIVKAQR